MPRRCFGDDVTSVFLGAAKTPILLGVAKTSGFLGAARTPSFLGVGTTSRKSWPSSPSCGRGKGGRTESS